MGCRIIEGKSSLRGVVGRRHFMPELLRKAAPSFAVPRTRKTLFAHPSFLAKFTPSNSYAVAL